MLPATILLGALLGLVWGAAEALAAAAAGEGRPLAQLGAHLVLGLGTVLGAWSIAGLLPRLRERRTELSLGLAALGIAAAVVFVRAHFAWLADEGWSSRGHRALLAAALGLGALAGAATARAARRALAWRPLHSSRAAGAAAVLALAAAVPAARGLDPSWRVELGDAGLASAAPCNVLLVTVDTLRRDHLGVYGYGRATDAALERFSFVRFENAVAVSPWTRPSTASILTGTYPSEHTAVRNESILPDGAVTLAERLAALGFATAHCSANLNASGVFGMDQGAQFAILNPDVPPLPLAGTTLGEVARRRAVRLEDARELNEMALAFLDAAKGRRFYLYLHYQDPHAPYDPPREQLERYAPGHRGRVFLEPRPALAMTPSEVGHMVARYDGEVQHALEALGRILQELERRGELEETLVVVTSDHGEAFGEHGRWRHSSSVYEELLAIPLLVRPPGAGAPGPGAVASVAVPASHVDLVPTVLDYVGAPSASELPGRSLRPWIEGAADPGAGQPLLLAEAHKLDAWSCRRGTWKLIAEGEGKRLELYDLESDPSELVNLAGDARHAGRARELLEEGLRLRRALRTASLEGLSEEAGAEVRARLRAMGYVE